MNSYLTAALVLAAYMLMWFVISIIRRRNDVADTAWGLGFVLVAWLSLYLGGASLIKGLVCVFVSIWGIRLAQHVHARNKNKPEDFRYAQWRQTWKYFYLRSFFQIYVLQGVLLYLISLPVQFIQFEAVSSITWFTLLGCCIWAFGLVFESVSDAQLKAFIIDPRNKGKIMDRGLWAYSRHPNYFGEVTCWWGLYIVGLSQSVSAAWTIIGPLTITALILFVSGVPMLEKKYLGNSNYEEYKKRTSIFIPWFRKK